MSSTLCPSGLGSPVVRAPGLIRGRPASLLQKSRQRITRCIASNGVTLRAYSTDSQQGAVQQPLLPGLPEGSAPGGQQPVSRPVQICQVVTHDLEVGAVILRLPTVQAQPCQAGLRVPVVV